MREQKPDEMEFAAIVAMLLWNLDHRNDPSISEESRDVGQLYKAKICEELHDYYTQWSIGYAYRLAELISVVHRIDVRFF